MDALLSGRGGAALVRAGRISLSTSVFAMVLMFSLSAAAQDALSLTDAQRLAVDRSRQLAGQDAAIAADHDMAVSAAQNPDPVISAGIDNMPVDGTDRFSVGRDFMTQRRIGVVQEFTRDEKRHLRSERYEEEADKTRVEKAAAILAIQRDTALAWLDRYYAEASSRLLDEQIRQAQSEIEAAQTAYRSGKGSQSDVLAARANQVELQDRASEMARKVRIAKIALVREIGKPGELPLAQKPSIDHIPIDLSKLDEHVAMHPEIVTLAKEEELAAIEARLAQANKQTDWSVELSYALRGPQYSNMASIGVSVPLQWDQTNRQDREVAAKLAQADQARALREEAIRTETAKVASMIAEWESVRERQTRLEQELVPLATERIQAELAAYRGGKSSLNNVLAARRNEVDARLQALQMEAETARLWAQLNFHFLHDDAGSITPRDAGLNVPNKD
ncbi:outer membrane efflux protein [mine drainage metagenome]|uniref:Outer membrane efflux protein n=1 Tax=mine drainage metagenome TaxID=410659 RepID=A0A1J5SC40_9ZZZZ